MEETKLLLKKYRQKHRLIVLLVSIFFFVAGSASSITLYNYFYGGIVDEELRPYQEAYNIIKNEWYFGTDELTEEYFVDGLEGMVNGYVSSDMSRLDPYLTYYPREESKPTYGIGVEVVVDNQGFPLYDGYFYVSKVYGLSAAAGVLQEGDLISKVNGESVRYLNSNELKIKGEKGTEVNISYIRDGIEYEHTFIRKEAVEHSVTRQLNTNYAVLKIDGFTTTTSGLEGTAELAEKYLKEIRKEKISNLIIDLRDNPGGYISAFKSLSELFLPTGKSLGTYINKYQEVIEEPKTNSSNDYEFEQIIILVNGSSASASESFAVCMQDNLDNVTVVGTLSYGKGIAQKTISLSDGSSLRFTYAEYFRPNGGKVHKVGVTPDLEIKIRETKMPNKDDYYIGDNLNEVTYGLAGKAYYEDKLKAYDEQLMSAISLLG
jgi:carboxyl-terminal processing protease